MNDECPCGHLADGHDELGCVQPRRSNPEDMCSCPLNPDDVVLMRARHG